MSSSRLMGGLRVDRAATVMEQSFPQPIVQLGTSVCGEIEGPGPSLSWL